MGSIFQQVAFRQSEVNYVDFVSLLAPPDHKIVGLNIPVEIAFAVNELDSLNHLNANHESGLEVELAANVDINIFQGLT